MINSVPIGTEEVKVHRTECMLLLLTTDTAGLEGYLLNVSRTLPLISDQDDEDDDSEDEDPEDEDCELQPPMIYNDIDRVCTYTIYHIKLQVHVHVHNMHDVYTCMRPAISFPSTYTLYVYTCMLAMTT